MIEIGTFVHCKFEDLERWYGVVRDIWITDTGTPIATVYRVTGHRRGHLQPNCGVKYLRAVGWKEVEATLQRESINLQAKEE